MIWGVVILLVKVYRPYIYSNGLYDYHIADSLSSLFYPAGFFFLIYALFYQQGTINEILIAVLVVCYFFELVDIFYPPHRLDYFDLITLSIGSFLTYWLLKQKRVIAFITWK